MQGHLEELKRGGRPMTKNEIKLNILNKGIDELIKKYEDKIYYIDNIMNCDSLEAIGKHTHCYKEIVQDLKNLKGE